MTPESAQPLGEQEAARDPYPTGAGSLPRLVRYFLGLGTSLADDGEGGQRLVAGLPGAEEG